MTPISQINSDEVCEIGGYAIVEKLREGGMATLYLATRGGARGFSRPVVIKVMHNHVAAQSRMTQMFVDEALLGSHLQHPNIGHIEEFGEEAGRYFLVMEYIDGCSVSDLRRHFRVEKQAMNPLVAAYIVSQAAQGLHHAHGANDANGVPLDVVHRDVSPGNILVSRSGHVKVIDFGVAKSELRTEHTIASLKGKFRYMSPEQARGRDLDPRSDVYCLGLILWELLSNRPAIQGKSDLELLESARSPSLGLVTEVSDELAMVVDKALAEDPDERWSTALEFAQAIRAAIPAVQDYDPSEIGAMVQTLPRGGRSHATLASSSELSKSLLSRSESRSELRQRAGTIPEVDIGDGEHKDKKRHRLIIGALIVIAVAILLLFIVPTVSETNARSDMRATPLPAQPEVTPTAVAPTAVTPTTVRPPAAEPPAVSATAPTPVHPLPTRDPASEVQARTQPRETPSRHRAGRHGTIETSPSVDPREPEPERSVRTRGDSRPERVRGVLLDTGGEDDTRVRPPARSSRSRDGVVRVGGTLLAE